MASPRQTFSVLICTCNRHELLGGALRSLVAGTIEKPDQIVVVNGGGDRSDAIVESFSRSQSFTSIRLIKTINKNTAVSRNLGLPHCNGDIIAMTDDDAEVLPDWVTQMKRAHREHPEAGAVGGVVLGVNTRSVTGRVAELITFPRWPEGCYVRTLPGVNISYKRDVVERVGGLDESLLRGEDVDYNWRVKRLGYEVYFDPAVRVYHHHRPAWGGLLRQQYMYGRGYYLVRRKWPDMYCVYPHRIRKFKDVLKAGNLLASVVYQPVLKGLRLPSTGSRLAALPLLFATSLAWRSGLLAQAAVSGRKTCEGHRAVD